MAHQTQLTKALSSLTWSASEPVAITSAIGKPSISKLRCRVLTKALSIAEMETNLD